MKERLNLTISMIIMVAILNACGSSSDVQIKSNFYVSFEKLPMTSQELSDSNFEGFISSAIDKYEEVYGSCGKDVYIEFEQQSFYSEELDKYVAGLSYNYGNSCEIKVGFDTSSKCQTAQILWHELYHCCKNVPDHGQWVYDLFDLRDDWASEGGC